MVLENFKDFLNFFPEGSKLMEADNYKNAKESYAHIKAPTGAIFSGISQQNEFNGIYSHDYK